MEAHLIDEDQSLGLKHLGYGHPPGDADPLVFLAGNCHPFFLVESIRFMVRHTTDRLTSSPATTRNAALRVLAGEMTNHSLLCHYDLGS
jgi:hypothetical protein